MIRRQRPKYLFVVPSTCQMYSGTGRAIFDWMHFAKDAFEFSILMDASEHGSWSITREFCRERGVNFISATPWPMPGCCDLLLKETANLLVADSYDIVECVSWAAAATSMQVLSAIPKRTILVYTPHTQPLWTLPESANTACVGPIFSLMLQRCDAVFLDSAAEARLPAFDGHGRNNLFVVPLGVDTSHFREGGLHDSKMVLSVCDFGERRKRTDLLFSGFEAAYARDPSLKLHLAGKGSDACAVPAKIKSAVVRHGYVTAEQLLGLYQRAGVFMLMSDFEAFGLPIAEALCCGTQVLINRQDVLIDLFDGLPGVNWTVNTSVEHTADILISMCTGATRRQAIRHAASKKFSLKSTYGQKLVHIRSILQSRADRSR